MKRISAFAVALAVALPVVAQTKWDMPTAYPASNFHTENIQQFANDVDKATGGGHANGCGPCRFTTNLRRCSRHGLGRAPSWVMRRSQASAGKPAPTSTCAGKPAPTSTCAGKPAPTSTCAGKPAPEERQRSVCVRGL